MCHHTPNLFEVFRVIFLPHRAFVIYCKLNYYVKLDLRHAPQLNAE